MKFGHLSLRVVQGILLLYRYLKDTKISVQINRRALNIISKLVDYTEKLARLPLCLMEYDFYMIHQAGAKHQAANKLSPLHAEKIGDFDINENSSMMFVTTSTQKRLSNVRN